jgi:DnaJ-class molecular chaperone
VASRETYIKQQPRKCSRCAGTGEYGSHGTCFKCHGTGVFTPVKIDADALAANAADVAAERQAEDDARRARLAARKAARQARQENS